MIKASAILAIAFFVTGLMRRRAAAERHIVWAAAIFSAAALPLLSFILPTWQPSLAGRVAASLPGLYERMSSPGASAGAVMIFHAQSIETTAGIFERVWPFLWLVGSFVCLFVAAKGIIRQIGIGSSASDFSTDAARSMLPRVAKQLRCNRQVRLKRGAAVCMPMTWGVIRPQLLLPSSCDQWPTPRLHVVIAHELAHVQRLDWLFQTLVQAVCAVYWFNPMFWIAANRLHRESELACDDAVLGLGIDARDYAVHLFEIARGFCQSNSAWSPTLAMARRSALEHRFATLLKSSLNRSALGVKKALLISLGALVLAIPIAAMHVSAPADAASPVVDQYTTPPLYSDEARSQGVEGKVTIEVAVGVEGKAKALQVVRGLGYGLDQNALVAVRDWHFVPAKRNGHAVESITRLDVEFSLKTAELNELIANDMATQIGPGVTPPQVVHRADAIYPASMKAEKDQGAVVLDAVIPEDGVPRVIRVIRSLDWQFDEIAINSLKEWRFSPAMKDGKPVKVRMNVAVEFSPNS
jgi:TonB family protein